MPLRTMLKLRRFGAADVLSADPGFIRAAVELDRRARLDPAGTTLEVTLERRGSASEKLNIPLRVLATGTEVHVGLPVPRSGRYWTLLALTEEGTRLLRAAQERASQNLASYTGAHIEVKAAFGDPPADLLTRFPIQLWARLTPELGFLRLFEGNLDFSKLEKWDPPPPSLSPPSPASLSPSSPA